MIKYFFHRFQFFQIQWRRVREPSGCINNCKNYELRHASWHNDTNSCIGCVSSTKKLVMRWLRSVKQNLQSFAFVCSCSFWIIASFSARSMFSNKKNRATCAVWEIVSAAVACNKDWTMLFCGDILYCTQIWCNILFVYVCRWPLLTGCIMRSIKLISGS